LERDDVDEGAGKGVDNILINSIQDKYGMAGYIKAEGDKAA
jgi:hypothetical protein